MLSSRRIASSAEDFAEAWINEVSEKGISCLPLDTRAENLIVRTEFINQQKDIRQDVRQNLRENVREWLLPFLGGAVRMEPSVIYDALYWYLHGEEADRLAPGSITLENGRCCKVKSKGFSVALLPRSSAEKKCFSDCFRLQAAPCKLRKTWNISGMARGRKSARK